MAADTKSEKVNILLVDDQESRLLTYDTILRDLGQNLVHAHSGFEALQCLMKAEFAVVLLDVSMPGMDGFETAGLIHEHPRFERTPIIFVTGVHVTEFECLKGYKLGAIDYVNVPVVPEILRGKISVLVELHLKRRELQTLNASLAEANALLALKNTTLEAEKTRELERLNLTLRRANAELEQANQALQSEIMVRARAESALKEADRNKDEFLAILAHELRNPLAPINNAVEIMRRRPLEDPQLTWARDIVARQLGHLARLVDDLLDVSRITRGAITLAREPVQVATVVTRAIETVQPLITRQSHELLIDVPDPALEVEGDLTRLTQALSNLLNNAAKYTEAGGRINVSVVPVAEEQVEIRVKDSGLGISPELLPRLFNLFTQADATTHRADGGLGIGLALVRKLVEMHGGSVAAYSQGANSGSEFVMRLPLMMRRTQRRSAVSTAAQEGRVTSRRILVADDNADSLESLAALLRCDGHEVYTACDGEQALEQATKHRPEIALLDLGMPKLDGVQVGRKIRAEPWGRDMTLIALTGWGQDSDRKRTQAAGFDAHLVKPLDVSDLSVYLQVPVETVVVLAK
ncbi:MAG TPA: response regulator [Steroidobacteraceae bacterium]|jgi:signal transduction histidine kinase|nr:response regulator [Steroidobacteraceae bacterium]